MKGKNKLKKAVQPVTEVKKPKKKKTTKKKQTKKVSDGKEEKDV